MKGVVRLPASIGQVAIAFGVAVCALREWCHGAALFGVALTPPKDVDQWAKVLSFTFGVPAGVLALFTFLRSATEQRRSNLWKRREYVATRFDRLDSSDKCRAAMRMLDYEATTIRIEGMRDLNVDDKLVMGALAPHEQSGTYTAHEQVVRDAFDAFLGELDRLGDMVAAGLVEVGDIGPYADYWLQLFDPAQRARPPVYGAVLRRYVRTFHFDALAQLLQRRKLMLADGRFADRQVEEDDALIASHDAAWLRPSPSAEATGRNR